MIEDINTYEKAINCFTQVNCVGQDNCVFIANKDTSQHLMSYAVVGGLAGGLIQATTMAVLEDIDRDLNELNNYFNYLVNETEMGIGIIPLGDARLSLKNATPLYDKFVFVPKEIIENIEIKNYSMFAKTMQVVKIKVQNLPDLRMAVAVKNNKIPYQEINFKKFMGKYKK